MITYVIKWATGDTDTCFGRKELMELLEELDYTISGGNIMDGDHIAGQLTIKK